MHFFCGLFSQQTTHLFSTFIKPSVATRDQKLLEISGVLAARAARATASKAICACDAQVGSGYLDRCIAFCHSSELFRHIHAQVFSSGVTKPGTQHMHRAQRIRWSFQPPMTPTGKTHGNASRCFKQCEHMNIEMQNNAMARREYGKNGRPKWQGLSRSLPPLKIHAKSISIT